MGGSVSRTDFEWVYTQHPHVARRKLILGECGWRHANCVYRLHKSTRWITEVCIQSLGCCEYV